MPDLTTLVRQVSQDQVIVRTGAVEVLCYNEVLSRLRQPGTSTLSLEAGSLAAARIRQGGFQYGQQLSEDLQDQIDLRKAIDVGVDHLVEMGAKVTAACLDRHQSRRVIRNVASQLYTTRTINLAPRGGSTRLVAFFHGSYDAAEKGEAAGNRAKPHNARNRECVDRVLLPIGRLHRPVKLDKGHLSRDHRTLPRRTRRASTMLSAVCTVYFSEG